MFCRAFYYFCSSSYLESQKLFIILFANQTIKNNFRIIILKKINQFFEKIVSRKQVIYKNIRFFKKIKMQIMEN